jgi:hypothetical protein
LGDDVDSAVGLQVDEHDRPSAGARSSASSGVGRTVWREAVLVAAVATFVYRMTLSAVPALTHDSMGYLLAIQAGGDALYHPHHLAYNALSRAWVDIAGTLGADGDPMRTVETLNALLGGCAAALVWSILRLRAQVARALALAGTGGAALSFGFWFYSVSVEVYVLPLVFLLATLLVLTSTRLTVRTMVVVGLLNGLAVVSHQVNVLFAVVVVTVVARGVDRATALRRIAAYGAAAASVTVAAYGAVLAFVIRPASTAVAADWFTRYAQSDGYWHFRPDAPVKAATGFARSLVGGQFAYRLEPVRERLASAFSGRSLDDEEFLVRNLSPVVAVMLIVLAAVGALLLLSTLVRGIRQRRDLSEPARRVVRPLVAWLVTYSAFFLVWEPVNPEFWIPQATALWMVAAVLAGRPTAGTNARPAAPGRNIAPLACAAAAIALVNLVGTMLPASEAANDLYALRFRAVGEVVSLGDLVVVDHPHLGLGYAERYTEAETVMVTTFSYLVSTDEELTESPRELAARLERALDDGHRVAIDANLVDRPSDRRAERAGYLFAELYGDRWRLIEVREAAGWYVIDP